MAAVAPAVDINSMAREITDRADYSRAHAPLTESGLCLTMRHMGHSKNEGQSAADVIARLREIDEADVFAALKDSYVSVPLESADELMEFVQCLVDDLFGARGEDD